MSEKKRPKVYVLYTGGTIGSAGSPLAPLPLDQFRKLVAAQPGFTKDTLTVQLEDDENFVIDYILDAIEPPIDSSSMTPEDWITIADRLVENYGGYAGLVVLHGTDTMAFTSSALSFLLGDGVSKPVVVTGSQVPLQQTRNDALRNLVTSMVIAATEKVPEVTLFFNDNLMRGNRSVKVNASEFPAFDSPNFPPLATAGIQIEVNTSLLLAPPSPERSLERPARRKSLTRRLKKLRAAFEEFSVLSLILFPGIEASTVRAALRRTRPEVRGVILQAFGSGNAPANKALIAALKKAHEGGTVIVDVTQVLMGTVDLDAYESASGLVLAGAISGYDMTPEAALTKLIYLTGLGLDQKVIERRMKRDLRGELTRSVQKAADERWAFLSKVRGPSALARSAARSLLKKARD